MHSVKKMVYKMGAILNQFILINHSYSFRFDKKSAENLYFSRVLNCVTDKV